MDQDRQRRRNIFQALTQSFGKIVPAAFLRKPGLPGVDRIHPLIEGIYKPAWSRYALSIASMLESPYQDETHFSADGTWWMHYSPKAGSMQDSANASLLQCQINAEPLLVVRQLSGKASHSGATYRLLGLALVEAFETETHLFRIRSVPAFAFVDYLETQLSDDLIETALRLEALEEWQPFLRESRGVYRVSAEKRDKAFRDIVLTNYDSTCAVTGTQFIHDSTIEAQAVHIIAKNVRGTDDPRNGLALSRTAHWAFDEGIFTISDQYEILVHPEANRARAAAFPILQADGNSIRLPTDPAYRPHPEALAWHRDKRFGKFART
jgi:hypothetical protein